MAKIVSITLAALALCAFAACGTTGTAAGGGGVLPLPIFIPVPITLFGANIVPLDGQWVLADDSGKRACLTIQESRVSILNLTCSNDGSGFAARVIDAPVIARTGNVINLSVRYNAHSFDNAESVLSFTGTLQNDATFIGHRSDTAPDSGGHAISTNATFSRAP